MLNDKIREKHMDFFKKKQKLKRKLFGQNETRTFR
jgi:hypothetical protein